MFILIPHLNITQRPAKSYSIRQECREGFGNDNDTLDAPLNLQPPNQAAEDPALLRQIPRDTRDGSLGGLENRQNRSQEGETSLDLIQMSLDWVLRFLDLHPESHHWSLDNTGGPLIIG